MKEDKFIKKNDPVEILSDFSNIRFTRQMAFDFFKLLPVGADNPLSALKMIKRIKKEPKTFSLRAFSNLEPEIISLMSKVALINYGFPVGSCSKGRFKITTEYDKQVALRFLEKHKNDKAKYESGEGVFKQSPHTALRYRAISDIDVSKLPTIREMATGVSEEAMEKINIAMKPLNGESKMEDKEIVKEIYALSENTCVSFDDEMEMVVIRPYTDDKPNPKMIDSYEMSIDIISNHKDVVEVALHLGQKTWMDKNMLLDFIKMVLNKL